MDSREPDVWREALPVRHANSRPLTPTLKPNPAPTKPSPTKTTYQPPRPGKRHAASIDCPAERENELRKGLTALIPAMMALIKHLSESVQAPALKSCSFAVLVWMLVDVSI